MGRGLGGLPAHLALVVLFAMPVVGNTGDLPVYDKDFACTSQSDANRYVQDFNIDVRSFGGMELCNSQVDTKKLFNDLSIIEQEQFTDQGSNVFIKGHVPLDQYYTWMRGETRGIARGNDVPYATAYNSGGYFTMQDGWSNAPTLARVGVVIHEARHTEGYYHIQCTHGPYLNSGVDGCDTDFQYAGSHAIEMEYYARVVVQSQNLHPIYQSMARLMALARANFVFNNSPIKTREVLTLLDQNSVPWIFDNGQISKREALVDTQGVLKRSSQGATLFFGDHAVSLDLYHSLASDPALIDDYSYFKLLKGIPGMPAQPFKDVEEYDQGIQRYTAGLTQQGSVGEYIYNQGSFSAFSGAATQPDRFVTTLPDGTNGLFVRTRDGTLIPFNVSTNRLGTALSAKWPAQIAAAASVNGTTMLLTTDGQAQRATPQGAVAIPELQGVHFNQLVSSPIYDAFVVEK